MFLMSSLIFGALLAGIPILVHMLHRQKVSPVAWGAMQFLRDSKISQRRRKRIDHWWLMLTRMAAMAILALLLARPVIVSETFGPLAGGEAVDVAVVLDHSLSMGRRNGPQTLFEQGLSTLEKLRQLMRESDSMSIVLAEHRPNVRTSAPAGKEAAGAAIEALRQLPAGLTDGSIPDALLAARDLVNKGRNIRKSILVISDEQRSGWQLDQEERWRAALGERAAGPDKDLRVYLLPAAMSSTTPNLSISGITIEPGLVGTDRAAQVLATVTNAAPPSAGGMPAAPVQLIVDGRAVATQQVQGLAAGQSQTIRFETTFAQPGSHWVKVQAEAVDALEADNAAVAAVQVWQKVPVLVIDGELTNTGSFDASQFLTAALQPVDPAMAGGTLIQPKTVSVSEGAGTDLDGYMVVVLNDVPRLPPAMVGKLVDYVQAGHGLWIILGPRCEAEFYNGTMRRTALLGAQVRRIRQAPGQAGATVDVRQPDHPAVAPLTQSERNAFAGVHVRRWWQIDPESARERIVLGLAVGDATDAAPAESETGPLMLEQEVGRSGGRVTLWTSSVEGQWNNLPQSAGTFVPLVQETIHHLASGQTRGSQRQLEVGQELIWSAPTSPSVESLTLVRPDGQSQSSPVQVRGDKYVFTDNNTYQPGLYQLLFKPSQLPPVYFSVGLDRRELDPAVLTPGDIERLKDARYLYDRVLTPTLGEALGTGKTGLELWPYLVVLLLGTLIVETALTRRAVSLQTSAEAMVGISGKAPADGGVPAGGGSA